MELSVVLRDVSGKQGKGILKLRLRKRGRSHLYSNYLLYRTHFFDPDNGIIKKEFQEAAKWNSDLFAQKADMKLIIKNSVIR